MNYSNNKLRNDIQFLRGISVILVLLYHFKFNFFDNFFTKAGFIGVDIFFIISGYVITKIILDNKYNFSIWTFYKKRIKRLLPALLAVIVVSQITFSIFFSDSLYILKKNDDSIFSILLGFSNFWFWVNSTIYQLAAKNNLIFLHAWSLSIEIQFYLIFPILFFLFSRTKITLILITIFFLSYLSIFFLYINHNMFNFYSSFSRVFEITSGCLVFLLKDKIKNKTLNQNSNFIIILGFLMLIIYMIFLSNSDNHPNPQSIVFVIGISLVLFFYKEKFYTNVLFYPIILIGSISYSLYLWHFPLLVMGYNYFDTFTDEKKFILLIICFLLSICSYNFVEKIFRYKSFKTSIIYIITFLIVTFVSINFNNNKKYSSKSFILDNYFLADESVKFLKNNKKIRKEKNIFSFPSDSKNYSPQFSNLPKEKILFFGDSHSKDMFNIFYTNKTLFKNFEFARYGINLKDFNNFRKDIFLNSENFKKSDYLILSANYKMEDLNYIKDIEELSKFYKKKLVIILNRPVFEDNNEKNVSVLDIYFKKNPDFKKEEIDHFFYSKLNKNNYIKINNTIQKMYSGLNLFNLENIICSHDLKFCHSVDENLQKNFYDYGHLTLSGAHFFGRKIFELNYDDLLFFK